MFAGCAVFAFSQAPATSAADTAVAAQIASAAALAEELERALAASASDTPHTIEISGDIEIAAQRLVLPIGRSNAAITLRGAGAARSISLYGEGSLFTVGSGVVLILGENIALRGNGGNNRALVQVDSGGSLVMGEGAAITGNTGGAVNNWGVFSMRGGTISDNAGRQGINGGIGGSGGVFNAGVFVMYDGTISGNSGGEGAANRWGARGGIGGVNNTGRFEMHGGTISGNSGGLGSGGWGGIGGVSNSGVFFMHGGTISGNTGGADSGANIGASSPWDGWGGIGGVFSVGVFTMNGGTISGNSGGVGIWSVRYGVTTYGIFRITNGTIYGSDAHEGAANAGGSLRIFGVSGTARHGTFNSAGFFVTAGIMRNTDDTIHVVDGVILSPVNHR